MKYKVRSPFFYVGDKYKIMPQLIQYFPENIQTYYEPFVGGGSSFLYVEAKKYILNDNNEYIIDLHKYLVSNSEDPNKLFDALFEIIKRNKLSCSFLGINVPDELKFKYIKTYYSRYNKENYLKLRQEYNKTRKISDLYILLIYGFNHMIRFNSKGEFNLPVGNVDFNKNVYNALKYYLEYVSQRDIEFSTLDYIDFIKTSNFQKGDFVYLDPPYLISKSEYNKNWEIDEEKKLYSMLEELNDKGVKFGLSNITDYKAQSNDILKEWMGKYNVYAIKSNYISRFDNSIKNCLREVFITNYEKK